MQYQTSHVLKVACDQWIEREREREGDRERGWERERKRERGWERERETMSI